MRGVAPYCLQQYAVDEVDVGMQVPDGGEQRGARVVGAPPPLPTSLSLVVPSSGLWGTVMRMPRAAPVRTAAAASGAAVTARGWCRPGHSGPMSRPDGGPGSATPITALTVRAPVLGCRPGRDRAPTTVACAERCPLLVPASCRLPARRVRDALRGGREGTIASTGAIACAPPACASTPHSTARSGGKWFDTGQPTRR